MADVQLVILRKGKSCALTFSFEISYAAALMNVARSILKFPF